MVWLINQHLIEKHLLLNLGTFNLLYFKVIFYEVIISTLFFQNFSLNTVYRGHGGSSHASQLRVSEFESWPDLKWKDGNRFPFVSGSQYRTLTECMYLFPPPF